jgi:ferritin-like metal-binding protein YciE
MTKINDAMNGFHLRIKILYDIEKQLEKALPKMAEAAASHELATIILDHLEETKEQRLRLEQLFDMFEVSPQMHTSEGIRGIIADGTAMASADAPGSLRDVLIAGAGREVEHYEIACYSNAIEEAKGLGDSEAVGLLELTLVEEVAADDMLKSVFKDNLKIAQQVMT